MTYGFNSYLKESKYDKLPVDKGKGISLESFIEHVRSITGKDTGNPDALIVLALYCCLQPEEPEKPKDSKKDEGY